MELEHFGNPKAVLKDGNLGMAMLFEHHLLEQMVRVQQPPKCERSLALRNLLEREKRQVHLLFFICDKIFRLLQ